MSIRFINTTTNLPINDEIETLFLKTIRLAYKDAVESAQRQAHVDIFFVNEDDPDLETTGDISMDLLGVYISLHPEFHRTVIKVSPEKIMDACVSLKKIGTESLPLARLYPTLLVAVVIHELAHWIMDASSRNDHDLISWDWLADCLEDDPQYNFRRTQHKLSHSATLHQKWRHLRRFIEESLAEAFVLKQNFKGPELDFLKRFVAASPPGYRQGGLWSGNLSATLRTAQTWAHFKRNGDHQRWSFIFDQNNTPTEVLVDLLKSNQSVSSVDFVRDFYQHLQSCVSAWQIQFEGNKPAWDERLNSVFGVFYTLTTWGKHSPSSCLKLLKQWAANGSPEGFDEFHKALAETAKAKCKYHDALQYQKERLKNLPNLKHNEYWLKHDTEKITSSISELEALIG